MYIYKKPLKIKAPLYKMKLLNTYILICTAEFAPKFIKNLIGIQFNIYKIYAHIPIYQL